MRWVLVSLALLIPVMAACGGQPKAEQPPPAGGIAERYDVDPRGRILVTSSLAGGRCQDTGVGARALVDQNGTVAKWWDADAGRRVRVLTDGFVVGAVGASCRQGREEFGVDQAYFVDPTGTRRPVRWANGEIPRAGGDPGLSWCSVHVDNPQCAFDLATGQGRVLDPAFRTFETVSDTGTRCDLDGPTVRCTADEGATWHEHPAPGAQSVLAMGHAVAVRRGDLLDVSPDDGTTWRIVDLLEVSGGTTPTGGVAVTASGVVLVAPRSGGAVLLRSVGPGLSNFRSWRLPQPSLDWWHVSGDLVYASGPESGGVLQVAVKPGSGWEARRLW